MRPAFLSALVLVALAVLIAVSRLHTYDEPLERDLANYAVVGHELLQGRKLYSDLWDNKPPASYLTYAAAELVAGYTPRAVYLLNVVAAIATLLGVYCAGSAVGAGRTGGLWAAVFWTAISGDMMLEANQPNSEVFINACLVWAFALLVRMENPAKRARRALIIAGLFALASLYKHVAIASAVMLAVANIAMPAGGAQNRRQAFGHAFVMGAVGAAAWLGVIGWFAVNGRLDAFIGVNVTFAKCHAAGENLVTMLSPDKLLPDFLWFLIPLMVLALAGAVMTWRSFTVPLTYVHQRPWVLWLAYATGTVIAIAGPGYFSRHYYQLWLPVLAVGAGWSMASFMERSPRWLAPVAGGIALLIVLAHELPLYRLPADDWSRAKYGEVFVASRNLAVKINELLLPGETFYEWGAESGLYYYSQRRPPVGLLHIHVLTLCGDTPFSRDLARRVLNDLERERPELIVVPTLVSPSIQRHPLTAWLLARHRLLPLDSADGEFHLTALRGGKLEARCVSAGILPAHEK